jgi:hypothetical protein
MRLLGFGRRTLLLPVHWSLRLARRCNLHPDALGASGPQACPPRGRSSCGSAVRRQATACQSLCSLLFPAVYRALAAALGTVLGAHAGRPWRQRATGVCATLQPKGFVMLVSCKGIMCCSCRSTGCGGWHRVGLAPGRLASMGLGYVVIRSNAQTRQMYASLQKPLASA